MKFFNILNFLDIYICTIILLPSLSSRHNLIWRKYTSSNACWKFMWHQTILWTFMVQECNSSSKKWHVARLYRNKSKQIKVLCLTFYITRLYYALTIVSYKIQIIIVKNTNPIPQSHPFSPCLLETFVLWHKTNFFWKYSVMG